jgi:hypothetical protein
MLTGVAAFMTWQNRARHCHRAGAEDYNERMQREYILLTQANELSPDQRLGLQPAWTLTLKTPASFDQAESSMQPTFRLPRQPRKVQDQAWK